MGAAVLAVAVVLLGAGLSLMAWIVKTLLTTASTLAATNKRLEAGESRDDERFKRLEGAVFRPAWEEK